MNSRERVMAVIRHKEADRVPYDFWGTSEAVEKLKRHFGVGDKEAVLDALDVDLRYIDGPEYVGPKLMAGDIDEDIWGVKRQKAVTGEDHNKSRHPAGPQTIVFWEAEGNNVIRYNELYSDPNHYYNDVIGGGQNGSYRGFPGADSDIYCNYFANCWDDGIEAEGGGQNVRIWNNYIENTMMAIANAATSIGPLYIWQNVTGRSYSKPGSSWNLTHGNFMKMGFANSEDWMTGHMYVFNNTLLQPNDEGFDALGGSSRTIKHCVTRNNIFNVRSTDTHSISTDKKSTDNDFDYDLLSAKRYPTDQEKHGIQGKPVYQRGTGFSFDTKTGSFQLAPDSPGHGKALVIPNFCEPINGNGKAPDMGAHQSGTAPMTFGVKAQFVP